MKIGITGANGFIGKSLVLKLKDLNLDFVTFSRKSLNLDINSYVGNISSEDKNFNSFIDEIDVLIHLVDSFNEDIDYLFNDQLKTNKVVFDLVKNSKIKKLIYLSSIAVYGEGYNKKETDLMMPITNYGFTKILSESIFNLLTSYNKNVIILRPSNIYGELSTKGVIYNFVNRIHNNNEIVIYGDGEQKREFLYIDDCLDAILKTIEYNKSSILNLSSGETHSLKNILDILKDEFKLDFKVNYLPMEINNPIQILSEDIRLIKQELGWEPKVKILDGLSKILGKKYM